MNFLWPTNDTKRIRTLQELRSPRVVEALPKEEIDDWLKQSVALVAGSVRGLGTNQRRIRYFGFERSNEQTKEQRMTFMTMFMVYGEPVGKGRPRFAKRGNFVSTYTPLKTKTYEDEIRMMARAAMGSSEPLDTPVTVAIYIRVGIPASFSKQKRKDALEGILKPTKKPDIDNIAKCFLDGMNDIVYLDDKQVVNLHITKVYTETPAVEVMVKEDLG